MRVYNTLNKRKEEILPLAPPKIGIYVCGPTTYNYIHLGNARPLVVFDSIRRYLSYRGYQVKYVQNFTDVDDKIIQKAQEEGRDSLQLAGQYIEEYFKDADALGIMRADVHPRVSQHIEDIIAAITALLDKGYAYEIEGDVFYRVKAFADYGKLSGRSLEEMLAGARVEVDERKEAPVDFALWKAAKTGEPSWDSPWGPGRPGWHIECSVMSMKYLGETLDIHGGGSDLIFPHHENEIAQAEALTGKPFSRYWIHNGFITINQEKMSKSLGNFFILRDILGKYPADVVRFYLLATHYRSPLDFDDGKLEEARRALGRLKTAENLALEYIGVSEFAEQIEVKGKAGELLQSVAGLKDRYNEAMDDDFNTARALGHLFEMAHLINSYLAESDKDDRSRFAVWESLKIFRELADVLGIFMDEKPGQGVGETAAKLLETMGELRQLARREKDFALADQIRDFMRDNGIKIEDTAQGPRLLWEKLPEVETLVKQLLDFRTGFKKNRQFERADKIRDGLQKAGIIVEDTQDAVRWRMADA